MELAALFHGFMHHETLAVPGYPYAVSFIRAIQVIANQPLALILDIDVFTLEQTALPSSVLERRLAEMRWLKNKVFFGSITEKAVNMVR